MPNPSARGYVLKDDMFVTKWLYKNLTFDTAELLQTCKCKTAKCVACKCAKLGISCLSQCLRRVYQLISYFSGINFCIILFR